MRDRNLDIYRGAIMIYVTCFVHLMYWEGVSMGIFESERVSFILFEMPVIFYIVGASYSLSRKKPYWEYIRSRVKRVVIPYWKYALFCLPLALVYYHVEGKIISFTDLFLYVFFTPLSVPRIYSHIWFVLPYLLIACCLPPVYRCMHRFHIPFIAFCACWVLLLKPYYPELVQIVLVYLFFTVWGMYYKSKLGWQNVVCVIVAVGYLVYALFVREMPFDMQTHKFPPDLLFVSYCMVVLGVGGIYIEKALVALYNRFASVRHMIDFYSKEGYEIYLVHPFTTLLLAGIKHVLGLNPIIADHLYLKVLYVMGGFLFLMYVNVFVLRLYNFMWSFIYKSVKTVFTSRHS